MDNKEKKYVHFNPTQINNYGSVENSVQTVSRVIKDQIDDPKALIDNTASTLNSLWSFIVRSIPYFIITVIVPFILCSALGWTLLYYVRTPNPNFKHFINGSLGAGMHIFGQIPEVIIILLPIIIIISCAILCLALSTWIVASLLYPNDPRGKRNFFTGFFGAQLGLFIYKMSKRD